MKQCKAICKSGKRCSNGSSIKGYCIQHFNEKINEVIIHDLKYLEKELKYWKGLHEKADKTIHKLIKEMEKYEEEK